MSSFSTVVILSLYSPFPCWTLWEKVIMSSPHLRSGKLCFQPLKVGIYINYLKFFFIGELSIFSPLFNHLFVCSITYFLLVRPHAIYFFTLGYNPILFYLSIYLSTYLPVFQVSIFYLSPVSNDSNSGHWQLFSWLVCPYPSD